MFMSAEDDAADAAAAANDVVPPAFDIGLFMLCDASSPLLVKPLAFSFLSGLLTFAPFEETHVLVVLVDSYQYMHCLPRGKVRGHDQKIRGQVRSEADSLSGENTERLVFTFSI